MAKPTATIQAINASDPSRADVLFTHSDGTTELVTNLGPIPIDDKDAAKEWLFAYEATMQAALDAKAPRVKGPKAVSVGDTLTLKASVP